jgi:hypothetical protein
MKTLRRRIARLALTLGVVSLVWACNAPFIPVPPPGMVTFTAQLVSDGANGQKTVWVAAGGPNDKAALSRFFIYDLERQGGVITTADNTGAFTAPPMDGTRGDRVQIYYQNPKGDYSQQSCRLLIEGPTDAPPCP